MRKEFDFEQVGKKLPYKAPESYIESFCPHIFINRSRKTFRSPLRIFVYAAAFVVIMVISSLLFVNPVNKQATESFEHESNAIANFNTAEFEIIIKNFTDEELSTLSVILDSELFDN